MPLLSYQTASFHVGFEVCVFAEALPLSLTLALSLPLSLSPSHSPSLTQAVAFDLVPIIIPRDIPPKKQVEWQCSPVYSLALQFLAIFGWCIYRQQGCFLPFPSCFHPFLCGYIVAA